MSLFTDLQNAYYLCYNKQMICFLVTLCLAVTSQTTIPQYDGAVVQFDVPALTFLAHNYQSGVYFDDLKIGDNIRYRDIQGNWQTYRVQSVLEFQALSPNSKTSDLKSLEGTVYTSQQIHELLYAHPEYLILQTCIYKDGDLNWGRLFVVSTKSKGIQYVRETSRIRRR